MIRAEHRGAYPKAIERDPSTNSLKITWADGHESSITYDRLRGYCPCAGCQGHMVREVVYRKPAQEVFPQSIEPVGNYAVSILWTDGHATGIYRFDFLRSLCDRD
ncbi:MAG: DUF971 domain-containing protein [Acidobacteriota bacterium]